MSSIESLNVQRMFNVNGLVALVNGGGSGLGAMMARGLAANGAIVYIGGRRLQALSVVATAFDALGDAKGKIIPLQIDVTNKESILRAVGTISSEQGKLNLLVNSAGLLGEGVPFKPTADSSPSEAGRTLFEASSFDEWSHMMHINTASIYFTATSFTGLLAKGAEGRDEGSSIINITSIAGQLKVGANHIPSAATKAASNHLSKIFATEFAKNDLNTRVNVISPALFGSEQNGHEDHVFSSEEVKTIFRSFGDIQYKGPRGGIPADIVSTVLLLASPAGALING